MAVERAIMGEKTSRFERAMESEKTIVVKRAREIEKTKGKKRASRLEKTSETKRVQKNKKTKKGGEMEELVIKEEKPFEFLINAMFTIEKLRVSAQVRQTHLDIQKRNDPETNELFTKINDLEIYIDGRIAEMIKEHPAHVWFSKVKGVGKENIGKVIGLIDIEKADTISALWKFAGFSVENGKAPKRQKGGKLSYNSRLRSMCWRLSNSIMKAGLRAQCENCHGFFSNKDLEKTNDKCPNCDSGKIKPGATSKFCAYYLKEKEKYLFRYQVQGVKIVPVAQLPKNSDGKRYEPEGMISEGHVHNQALRKMIKLFLACLWLSWREAAGLPTRTPYAIEYQGHTHIINPWDMTDKKQGNVRNP